MINVCCVCQQDLDTGEVVTREEQLIIKEVSHAYCQKCFVDEYVREFEYTKEQAEEKYNLIMEV